MASYRVLIRPSAAKELEAIPERDRRRIAERIAALAQSPRPHGCEKLSGREQYRIRQGDYRVVYEVNDEEAWVRVVRIGDRKDVYRTG